MGSEYSQSSVELQEPSSCYETALTDQYQVLRDIGQGAFAQVKLARHLRTGTEVAVKVLPKTERNLAHLSEMDLMKGLEHPHVIQLFQVIETSENIYMVMEHAGGGQLEHRIRKAHGMQEEEARELFRQMVSAVRHCHEKGIVHLDLKVDNMVLDTSGNIKLIDFGLSSRFSAGQKLNKFWGTVMYVSPEIVQWEEYEGPPADIWSLGVLLYYMLIGKLPFRGMTSLEVKIMISRGKCYIPPRISDAACSLIRQMLKVDPMQRPTAEQILGHPWLRQAEAASPRHASEPLPNRPDPAILSLMLDMGYNPYLTWVSLANQKYDEAMATYLILRHRIAQGAGCSFQVKGGRQRVEPCPGPSEPASEPALPTFPCVQQLPEETKQEGQKGGRCASMPAIPLHFLHGMSPSPSKVCQNGKTVSLMPDSSVIFSTSSQGTSTGQSLDKSRGWKGVTRRMATCIQKLCCCMPCFHRNRVAPMEGGHEPVRFQNRVAPA